MKNIIVSLIVIILLGYIILYFNQRKLLYFPTKSNPDLVDKIMKNNPKSSVSIDIKDGELRGYYINKKSETTIIYFGGNAENIEYFINHNSTYMDKNILSFYYRGYGLSKGDISEKNLFEDALKIYDFAKKDKNVKNIIIMGRSLGTGIATYLTYKKDVKKVILVSPYDSILKVAQEKFPFVPAFMLKDKFESDKYAKEIETPMLAIYSINDKVVTKEHSKKLIKSWKGKVRVIEINGYNHGTVANHPDVLKGIKIFLK